MFDYRRYCKTKLQPLLSLSVGAIACLLFTSPVLSQTTQPPSDRNPGFLFEDVPIPVSQPCSVGGIRAYVRQLNLPSHLALNRVYYQRLVSECGVLTVPVLIEALENPQENIRANVALAIGQIGTEASSAIPALIEALSDESDVVQMNAAYALGQMGWMAESALPALKEQLKNENRTVIASAADAIGQIGKSLIEKRLFEIYGEAIETHEINEQGWRSLPEANDEGESAVTELLEATYNNLYVPLFDTLSNLYLDRIVNPQAWRQTNGETAFLSSIDAIAAIGMTRELYDTLNVNRARGGLEWLTGGAQLVAVADSHLASNRPAICRVSWLSRVITRCRNPA
jgi:HEAT repeats